MATTAQLLQDSLLLIWNDRDASKRLAAMQRVYDPSIQFYEHNAGEAIVGHQAINELISRLQAEWPADFLFTLSQPAQANHQVQHAAWALGKPGAPPAATGVDIALVENGLIKALYLLLDASAAEAA